MASFFYRDDGAPRPNRPRCPTVLALIEHDGQLLLDRRADASLWALIGGYVEHDETLEDALRREVREETGLEIGRYEFFGTFSDPSRVARYADGNVFQLVTLAYRVQPRDVSALTVSPESVDLRFFAVAELPIDELIAVHEPILTRYLSGERPPFFD